MSKISPFFLFFLLSFFLLTRNSTSLFISKAILTAARNFASGFFINPPLISVFSLCLDGKFFMMLSERSLFLKGNWKICVYVPLFKIQDIEKYIYCNEFSKFITMKKRFLLANKIIRPQSPIANNYKFGLKMWSHWDCGLINGDWSETCFLIGQ